MLPGKGCLLRIFINESDRHKHRPLYEWLIERAREANIAGATVLRGMEGFGEDKEVHTGRILRLAQDLPIVVEIVDTQENVSAFMEQIRDVVGRNLMTTQDVKAHFPEGT